MNIITYMYTYIDIDIDIYISAAHELTTSG